MSLSWLTPVRRRSALVWGAILLLIWAAVLGTSSLASAAPPVKATIGVTQVYTPSIPDPNNATQAAQLVVKDIAFSVDFTIDPIGATTLSLTWVDPGTGKVATLGTYALSANQTSGTITAPRGIPRVANHVALTISAKSPGVTPGTSYVDVLKTYVSTDPAQTLIGIGGGGGPGVSCTPTVTDQTCGDLVLPSSSSVTSASVLLTQGSCDGVCTALLGGSVLEWLAALGPNVTPSNPAVFIAKCDKSLCAGKGIKSYTVSVEGTGTTDVVPSQPCTSKGIVNFGQDFCTDYVQSTRDGAGDLLLYVLFAKDARIIW